MEIVGLTHFVNDDVNKFIFRFLGFKAHLVAVMLKEKIITK